jgi:Sec-independent protein translocase protein TatA
MPLDGAFSPLRWLVVGVVALLVFNPKELPGAARRLGGLLRDAQRIRSHLRTELRDLVAEFDRSDAALTPVDESRPDRQAD